MEALERLGRLLDAGVLTKEEFDAEKGHLLQTRAPRREYAETTHRTFPKKYLLFGSIAAAVCIAAAAFYLILKDIGKPEQGQKIGVSSSSESHAENASDTSTVSITFADASRCEPGPSFLDLLTRLKEAGAAENGSELRLMHLAGTPDPVEVQSAVQSFGDQQVRLSRLLLSTEWKGLRVTEVRTTEWDEGAGFQLRFASSPENVVRALRSSGFPVKELSTAATANGFFVGVERSGIGSTLTCIKSGKADQSPVADEIEQGDE